jgi:hypothetical protein
VNDLRQRSQEITTAVFELAIFVKQLDWPVISRFNPTASDPAAPMQYSLSFGE